MRGKKAKGFILQGILQWPCSLPMPWLGKKGLPRLHLCIFHRGELLLCPSLTQLKVWTSGGGKGMSLAHVHQKQAEIFIYFRHPFQQQQKIPHLPSSKKEKKKSTETSFWCEKHKPKALLLYHYRQAAHWQTHEWQIHCWAVGWLVHVMDASKPERARER